MIRQFPASVVFLCLAACATAVGTPYAPADNQGFGYVDQRIEADRFRVVFSGDGGTPSTVVEDFALLRAAELTLENGFDWFRVTQRSLDAEERGGVGLGAGVGTGSYGRRGGVNVGVGGDLGTIGARRFFTARLEVLMGTGPVPDEPDVYVADEIESAIRARIDAVEGA